MNKQLLQIKENYQVDAKQIFDQLDISEGTRKDYQSRIGAFIGYVQKEGFNRDSFLNFKRQLEQRADYTAATKNKYLATAKVFLKELNRQGLLPTDITQNIKSFNQSKKHKRDGLTEDEIQAISQKLQSLPETAHNSRLKGIFSLLTLQGLRQVEITRLDVKDLDLVSKTAFVQGKGSSDKELINLHPETVKNLISYLKANKIGSGPLFVSRSNSSKNHRLTTRALRLITKNLLTKLDINKCIHGFRHYFTSMLIRTYKGDLLEVAQYTRHKSLEMLQVYNDNIKRQADLPRFYATFEGINF